MTKLQTWNKVRELLSIEGIDETSETYAQWKQLFEPKSRGANSQHPPIEGENGWEYYCRYTEKYWPEEETIFTNQESREKHKSKGYSKLGISLWNEGQRILKNAKEAATDVIMSENPSSDENIEKMKAAKDIIVKDWNSPTLLQELLEAREEVK